MTIFGSWATNVQNIFQIQGTVWKFRLRHDLSRHGLMDGQTGKFLCTPFQILSGGDLMKHNFFHYSTRNALYLEIKLNSKIKFFLSHLSTTMKPSKTLKPFWMYPTKPYARSLSSISTANRIEKTRLLYSKALVSSSGCKTGKVLYFLHLGFNNNVLIMHYLSMGQWNKTKSLYHTSELHSSIQWLIWCILKFLELLEIIKPAFSPQNSKFFLI